jgi:hypothetical protein
MSTSAPIYQLAAYLNDQDDSVVTLFSPTAELVDVASKASALGQVAIRDYFRQYFFDKNVTSSIKDVVETPEGLVAAVSFVGDFTDDFAPSGTMDGSFTVIITNRHIQSLQINLAK